MKNKLINGFRLFLPITLGSMVGFIIKNKIDYDYLIQPMFAPPKWAFPVAWSVIYLLMGISYYNYKKNNIDNEVDVIYYIQLFFNIMWSFLFFNLKLRLIATIWIFILDILILIMQNIFRKRNKLSFNLNIPYMIWMLFATYLSLSIYLLN